MPAPGLRSAAASCPPAWPAPTGRAAPATGAALRGAAGAPVGAAASAPAARVPAGSPSMRRGWTAARRTSRPRRRTSRTGPAGASSRHAQRRAATGCRTAAARCNADRPASLPSRHCTSRRIHPWRADASGIRPWAASAPSARRWVQAARPGTAAGARSSPRRARRDAAALVALAASIAGCRRSRRMAPTRGSAGRHPSKRFSR